MRTKKCSLGDLLTNKKKGNTRPACNLIWSSFTAFYIPQKNRKLLFRSLACPASGNLAAAVEWATGTGPINIVDYTDYIILYISGLQRKITSDKASRGESSFFVALTWLVGKK